MKLLGLKHSVRPRTSLTNDDSPGLWHDRSLLDLIAEDTHDRWALRKFREGYCHGPVRCPALRLEPLLLEYNHLESHVMDRYREQAASFLRWVGSAGLSAVPAPVP